MLAHSDRRAVKDLAGAAGGNSELWIPITKAGADSIIPTRSTLPDAPCGYPIATTQRTIHVIAATRSEKARRPGGVSITLNKQYGSLTELAPKFAESNFAAEAPGHLYQPT